MPISELLTAEQLAERLKISPHTVRLWSTDERIPTIWLSRTVRRFDLAEVVDALRAASFERRPQTEKGVSR